jgi:hypothetical protein
VRALGPWTKLCSRPATIHPAPWVATRRKALSLPPPPMSSGGPPGCTGAGPTGPLSPRGRPDQTARSSSRWASRMSPRPSWGSPVAGVVIAAAADAEAGDQPPSADAVEAGELLAPQQRQQHRGGEPDALGRRGGRGQRHQRLVVVVDDAVAHPRGEKPRSSARRAQPVSAGPATPGTAVQESDSGVHGSAPTERGRC